MPLFTWLDDLPESAWTGQDNGWRFIRFSRQEFAERCRVDPKALVSHIRQWVLSQHSPRYAIAWSESEDPSALVIVSRTGQGPSPG